MKELIEQFRKLQNEIPFDNFISQPETPTFPNMEQMITINIYLENALSTLKHSTNVKDPIMLLEAISLIVECVTGLVSASGLQNIIGEVMIEHFAAQKEDRVTNFIPILDKIYFSKD